MDEGLRQFSLHSDFLSVKTYSILNVYRRLAQLVERHPYKVDVVGSSPAPPTTTSFRT